MFSPNGKKQRGLSAIEMVISLPLIFMLLAAVLELGFYLVQYNTLNKLVENAARYAVVMVKDSTHFVVYPTDHIRCVALTGNPNLANSGDCEKTSILPGMTKTDIVVIGPDDEETDYITITANYKFSPLGPIVGMGVLDSGYMFKIYSSVTMRVKP